MHGSSQPDTEDCAAGCSRCTAEEPSSQAGAPSGVRMAALSAGFLLAPLALAILGAVALPAAWRHEASQLLGGLAGLGLGIVASALAARRLHGAGTTQEE